MNAPNHVTEQNADPGEKPLVLANRLFQEFHTRCFWHCPHDLVITQELLPMVLDGLRKHGGRQGYLYAAALEKSAAIGASECR